MPLFRPFIPRPDDPVATDIQIAWHAPCIVIAVSQDSAEGPVRHALRGLQLLAQETETTTHYHVLGSRTMATNNLAASAAMRDSTPAAFANEDGPILKIGATQPGRAAVPQMRPALLSSDGSATRVRRAYEALLDMAR